jgi:queuine tRNA-ribosyltransferase
MFDCVLPARSGRNGQAFTRGGVINIKNSENKYDSRPLDEKCTCTACTQHTRAYLHHLFKSDEILGAMLLTEHNIMYYQDLMRDIRTAIEKKRYGEFVGEFKEEMKIY